MGHIKDLTMYMKIEFDSKPTDYDKIGCDGIYAKYCEPLPLKELINKFNSILDKYETMIHSELDGTSMLDEELNPIIEARKYIKEL